MFDLIIHFGVIGAISIIAIFITVFILAKPNTEITFWGIKFQKRDIDLHLYYLRRYPKKTPELWKVVFSIFKEIDKQNIVENTFFDHAKLNNHELEIRNSLEEMKKYGLIKNHWSFITLTKRGLEKLNREYTST